MCTQRDGSDTISIKMQIIWPLGTKGHRPTKKNLKRTNNKKKNKMENRRNMSGRHHWRKDVKKTPLPLPLEMKK
jgi:hypothetical protein